jgi:hypothetical protein
LEPGIARTLRLSFEIILKLQKVEQVRSGPLRLLITRAATLAVTLALSRCLHNKKAFRQSFGRMANSGPYDERASR